MTQSSALPHFGAISLFQCLKPSEMAQLASHSRVRVFDRGETVFEEGDRSNDLSFVIFGNVKVMKAGKGRDVILGLFGPGEPIGAVAVFEGTTYPGTAVAIEPTTVLHVPEREFFATIDRNPDITRRLLQGLMLRQMEVTRRLADLTGSVEYRVARLFLTLAHRTGTGIGKTVEIPMALSRQEIADLTATTIETAIRVMSRWGKEGLVTTHPAGFTIHDLAALEALAAL